MKKKKKNMRVLCKIKSDFGVVCLSLTPLNDAPEINHSWKYVKTS